MVRKSCVNVRVGSGRECGRVECAAYRFMTQLELKVHVDEPVDENSAHAIRDVRLGCHVIGTWLVLDLKLAQVLVNILNVLHHVVGLVAIGSVNVEDRDCGSGVTAEETFKAAHKRIAFSGARAKS